MFPCGEREGELLTIEDLTLRVEEDLPSDPVLALERDRLSYFQSL